MADNTQKEHYKNLQSIKKLTAEINTMKSKTAALTEDETKALKKLITEHGKLKKAIIDNNKERVQVALDASKSEESGIKSLNGIYASLGEKQRETLDKTSSKFSEQSSGWIKKASKIGEVNRQIAQLDQSDAHAIAALQNERNDLMQGTSFLGKDIQNDLAAQNAEADKFASMSANAKSVLEGQHAVLDGIKKTIQGAVETAIQLYGNLTGAVGGLITGFGVVVGKIGKVNSELGTSMFQADGVARKAGVLSLVFEDAAQTAKDLSAALGDTNKATFELQASVGLMATNMGISGSEATKLVSSFSMLNGNSTDVALDMSKTSQEFAKQNGIIPAQLMGDLANSTEEFALFGKDGGENILKAAGYAAKLGTSMSTLSGIADGLLDFESSITKELELGAMLGKNINLNKARELAYSGDIEGATKETLKQLGGIEAFNKMDYYQKKQTADLLGVSVAELQKMNSKMENANTLGGVMQENFSVAGEAIDAGLNKYLGTGLKGLGGMITASGQLGMGFKSLGLDMGGMVKSTAQVLKNLLGMVAGPVIKGVKAIGGGIAGKVGGSKIGQSVSKGAGKLKDKLFAGVGDKVAPPKGGADALTGKKSIMGGMSKINMGAVLKGAAAMLIVAAAVFVFGKAVQEFMKVSWSAVGMAVVSMLALVGAVALLGAIMMSGVGAVAILAGAAAMLVVASAVLVLGIGLQAIGTGFEMLGAGISSLTPNLLAVGTSIMSMVTLLPMIGLLSIGLIALAGSLAYLALFGTLALPALMGLGFAMIAIGVGMGMLGSALTAIGTAISSMSENMSTFAAGLSSVLSVITLEKVVAIAGLAMAFMGLASSLLVLGISGLIAVPVMMGIGLATMLLGVAFNVLGTGMQAVGLGLATIMTSLGGLVAIIGPITMLSLALLGLSGALMGLGTSMAYLGLTGLPGLMVLGGIAAVGGMIITIADYLGLGGKTGGSEETGALEQGSMSEYETNMLAKMDQLIQATTSQRDIYLDKDKVTNIVMDRGERSAVNKFKLNRA